jgi:hypothetical protein
MTKLMVCGKAMTEREYKLKILMVDSGQGNGYRRKGVAN